MTDYRKGDKVRAQVWHDATVAGHGECGLVLVDIEGQESVQVQPSALKLVKRPLPPKPPIGAVAFGGPKDEFFVRVGADADPLGFRRLADNTWASWGTICTGPDHGPRDPVVYAPVKPAEVVGYMDRDGDVWEVTMKGLVRLVAGYIKETPLDEAQRLYGPLRPLIVDPCYVEEGQ